MPTSSSSPSRCCSTARNELAALFAPKNFPEAFLVDPSGTVRYRGRIDDLYSDLDKKRSEPTHRDLLDAMTAIATGHPIAVPETKAIGCPFEAPTTVNPNLAVTYNRDIAPIVFAHCAECHRPGEVAPFSLLTYQDAKKRAEGLARVTGRRLMPPWKAAVHYGEFPRRAASHRAANRPHQNLGRAQSARRRRRRPAAAAQVQLRLAARASPTWLPKSPSPSPCRPTGPTSFSTS